MKIQDYFFNRLTRKDVNLLSIFDDLKLIINNGRYQMRIVTSVPDWTGDDGEHLFYVSGTTRRMYVYDATNATWHYIEWTAAGASSGGHATQAFTNQTSVTVTHNYGFYPLVQVIDNSNVIMIPASITHNSLNDFTVTFAESTTGTILII